MDTHLKVDITFYVKNEKFASRLWASVPRVGDEVMLGFPDKKPFKVMRVVYGVESENEYHQQSVNVQLKRMKS